MREIIMFRWTENFSTQCHIDFCKEVAKCTNQKDMFMCLIRHHIREGHMQYLDRLYTDLAEHALPQDMPHKDWMK